MNAQRRSRSEWAALVAQQEASGLGVTAFAAQRGIRAQTLAWWRWRLRQEDLDFATVEIIDPPAAPAVFSLILPQTGVRIEIPPGFDAAELRRLVAALC